MKGKYKIVCYSWIKDKKGKILNKYGVITINKYVWSLNPINAVTNFIHDEFEFTVLSSELNIQDTEIKLSILVDSSNLADENGKFINDLTIEVFEVNEVKVKF